MHLRARGYLSHASWKPLNMIMMLEKEKFVVRWFHYLAVMYVESNKLKESEWFLRVIFLRSEYINEPSFLYIMKHTRVLGIIGLHGKWSFFPIYQ